MYPEFQLSRRQPEAAVSSLQKRMVATPANMCRCYNDGLLGALVLSKTSINSSHSHCMQAEQASRVVRQLHLTERQPREPIRKSRCETYLQLLLHQSSPSYVSKYTRALLCVKQLPSCRLTKRQSEGIACIGPCTPQPIVCLWQQVSSPVCIRSAIHDDHASMQMPHCDA